MQADISYAGMRARLGPLGAEILDDACGSLFGALLIVGDVGAALAWLLPHGAALWLAAVKGQALVTGLLAACLFVGSLLGRAAGFAAAQARAWLARRFRRTANV